MYRVELSASFALAGTRITRIGEESFGCSFDTMPSIVCFPPILALVQNLLSQERWFWKTNLDSPALGIRCRSTSVARQHPQAAPSTDIRSPPWAPPASLQTVHTTLTASSTLHQHLAAALQRHHHARSKAHTPLWQQHTQRQQHASSKALRVWYNYQQLKHFRGKCV